LIADEPTTALDVTIQAQILDLLRDLQKKTGMSILLVTHDLGVVAENADDVVVMYAGKVVERAPVEQLFENPRHPYTIGLFESMPSLGSGTDRLSVIEGSVPNPLEFPSGCKFRPRCAYATDECAVEEPDLVSVGELHQVACIHREQVNRESSKSTGGKR
jgi:oligopeptide/dipeptide ABC transporter ATP-binding protein